ncbi:MAG: nickel pincer cofactor biosynthesis protein LarC [Elusimicrobiota bacterium]|jgi:uncharacterized protein (TIGR00299 family) protein|nr:nickel pincer cofactor biosynthesis protein LarC [Elusimicrobiota bacterium]
MKILYLECSMGAAGDMLNAALYDLLDDSDKSKFLENINLAGLENTEISFCKAVKWAVSGFQMKVLIDGKQESILDEHSNDKHAQHQHHHKHDNNSHSQPHQHANINKIENIISSLKISDNIKSNVFAIYKIIADAESQVHGKTIEQIHFHEVGNMDAIADIVSFCVLLDFLKPDKIIVSPINTGSGSIKCLHGIVPVPAPATANILKDIPIFSSGILSELCTPTGAALLKHFANEFLQMPAMKIKKIGYGMGKKNFENTNCLRAFLGQTQVQNFGNENDEIAKLECNLDDITGEALSFACDVLLKRGALDVFTIPIFMKQNRPAFLLTCLCEVDRSNFFAELILKYTTTFGVRKTICSRYILERQFSTGKNNVKIKTAKGYNVEKSKAEYRDIANFAIENDISFDEALKHSLVRKDKIYEK